jgi:indole-3-glycerol phosphate synthase
MDFGMSDAIRLCKSDSKNAVIAEIKVYSPKYGDLLKNRDPLEILKAYERAGAAGISYITEPEYFKGDFKLFKKICKYSNLPVLRKDFITGKEEIERTAEAEGAAVLLIARLLKDKTAEMVDFALEHGLETIVEVHTTHDLTIATDTNSTMIGINNRNIFELEIDDGSVSITRELAPQIPDKFIKVSESGISNLKNLKTALTFADAVLVGTAFMNARNPEEMVKTFVEARLC